MSGVVNIIETGSSLGGSLKEMLTTEAIEPGSLPSYELCKVIYTDHPLGQKMADSPIVMAQNQPRRITVPKAPEEVQKAFSAEWDRMAAEEIIRNTMSLSRVYGIASLVAGCEQVPSSRMLDMEKIHEQSLFFNVLDPLNTAGSLVLNQVPTAPDFNKPPGPVRVAGQVFHASRSRIVMNESPVYLSYTTSAFGFVGRSVYQRALYPLKSFIRTMVADEMVATKLGLLIAKQKQPGSIISKMMAEVAFMKRYFVKQAQTGQVISIDIAETVETLNMQNVDGAGAFARTNILKNIATAADMPAKLLENETLVQGFGEGTEDAKTIARYIDGVRRKMQPLYAFLDNFAQYRAWSEDFFNRLQRTNPDLYSGRTYRDVFLEWRASFATEWPSLLIEPESEKIKVEQTKLEAIVAMLQSLMQQLDEGNQLRLIQWAADNLSEAKRLFPYALELDYDDLEEFLEQAQKLRQKQQANALIAPPGGGDEDDIPGETKAGPLARKVAKFA